MARSNKSKASATGVARSAYGQATAAGRPVKKAAAKKMAARKSAARRRGYPNTLMPVRKVAGGYRWGSKGKVYPTKTQAERQGRAAYAAGYRPKGTKKK